MSTEQSYKQFSGWLLNLLNTIASLLKVLIRSKRVKNFPVVKGGELVVIGTGPSLKDSFRKNYAYFESRDLMCVNTFSLTEDYVKLKPKYYVMLDPGLWLSDHPTLLDTIQKIKTLTAWPMTIFIPFDARNSKAVKEIMEGNSHVHFCFFNYIVFKGFKFIAHSLFRRKKAILQSQNVLVASVFLGVNMNYKRIELFGADHNWHTQLAVSDDNVVCLKHVHFYENEQTLKVIPFYKLAHVTETFRMDEIFHAWAKVFYGYIRVNEYAKELGCTVINRSEISFIDAFKREKF